MAKYSIEDTTLIALGDAVRSKTGIETKTELADTVLIDKDVARNSTIIYYFPAGTRKVQVKTLAGTTGSTTVHDEWGNIWHTVSFTDNAWSAAYNIQDGYYFQHTSYSDGVNRRAFEITCYDASGNILQGEQSVKNTMTPLQMAEAINNFEAGGGVDNEFLKNVIEGTLTEIKKTDLQGITKLVNGAFTYHTNLTSVDLPNTIESMGTAVFQWCSELTSVNLPNTIKRIEDSTFANCDKLISLTIPENVNYIGNFFIANSATEELTLQGPVPRIAGNTFYIYNSKLKKIYVPGERHDDYLSNASWGSQASLLTPNSKYVASLKPLVMVFYESKTYSIPLQCFDAAPTDFTITSSDEEAVTISNISASSTSIDFTVNALETEGAVTINVSVPGDNGHVFNRELTVNVYAELAESSYEVVSVDGVQYGFELNADGYWESTNKGKSSSYAYCKINISNQMGRTVYIDCINYAESSYDYGLFSEVSKDLDKSTSDGANVRHSFKDKQSPNIQTIEYTDAIGDCYITVKFKKDTSGDDDNDSLQFKVRFAE